MADLLKLNQLELASGHPLSLILPEGKLGMVLGAEGSGKGGLLRQISGIHPFATGEIFLQGHLIAREGRLPPPWERDIELVFRQAEFYPHLTVVENLLLVLQGQRIRGKRRYLLELLSEMGMAELANSYPLQLSGEERLYLQITRALVTKPVLLLLEEPLLDLQLEARYRLLDRLPQLMERFGCGVLLSTEVRDEGVYAVDLIGVMAGGALLQWGPPQTLYLTPKDRYVAHYMGEGVLIKGVVHDEQRLDTELGMVEHPTGFGLPTGTRLELLIRPDDLVFDEKSRRRARVIQRSPRGGKTVYHLQLTPALTIRRHFSNHLDNRIGGELRYRLDIRSMVLFKL
ncbi:MAG: ATP-binding cassette domain-containing protein [Gammaproteobacteria bacterium]|jgi:iron(III) transport system ATP-binding protein|nr:ATP-binding cassette domain-containing protein [Gammaproteobacteria bacterium]